MRTPESIIGNSAALTEVLEQVSRLARINRPILLLGERGTGKELAAERLHFLSSRWQAPLSRVNCAALADSLLESELFGHEPGAFTGATRIHRGRFERTDGGSLFLDELGTMSPRLQEKLLRLVEYGEFERLGGQETLRVDVRVIAATNSDLQQQVAQGKFRADLLDRLSFDVVHLPPLRHRIEDIALLAEHFAVQFCAELGWDLFPGFTEHAIQTLQNHSWPGNVRELKNAVERSLFRWGDPESALDQINIDPFQSPFPSKALEQQLTATDNTTEAAGATDFQTQVREFEMHLLSTALRQHGDNQRRTAAALGLSYDQMRGLVRKHKLTTRSG
ncbi:MAG: phage shock protein operon transcriptional activator [Halioglobus sp.]